MKDNNLEEVITIGSHVLVQRLNFKKVYRVSENGSLNLGKEDIKMSAIVGKPFWTVFRVSASGEKGPRKKILTVVKKTDSLLEDLRNVVPSGCDNRSIMDDGKSQKLSKEDIMTLRGEGKSGREIVTSLIENNASFAEKTEYSQEKYIRKKEKKYCQFVTVTKPTISALQEIYLRQDPAKIYGMRSDALAQVLLYSDVKANGNFLLYDSGTSGLVVAGLLSRIGANNNGNLVYLHSGDQLPQMPILRAMNFKQEQLDRLSIARIFDFLKLLNQKSKQNILNHQNEDKVKLADSETTDHKDTEENILEDKKLSVGKDDQVEIKVLDSISSNHQEEVLENATLKRKRPDDDENEAAPKKSRRVIDLERAVEVIEANKVDGLVIIAKEHPLSIVKALLPFVKLSRPFVIYHMHREPLQDTYCALKQEAKVVNLKLFSNFLRSYQILPDRTHPDILTNDSGGYILTGYLVC